MWDWGDGNIGGIDRQFASGSQGGTRRSWSTKGTYGVESRRRKMPMVAERLVGWPIDYDAKG